VLLVLIWLGCFALDLRSLGRPVLLPPFDVQASGDRGFPILKALAPWAGTEGVELEPGDRLVRLGNADLRGVGPIGLYARFVSETSDDRPLPTMTYERGGRVGESPIPSPISTSPALLVSAAFLLTALFLVLRVPPSPLVRALSQAGLVTAIATASPVIGGVVVNQVGLLVGGVAWALAFPLFLRSLLLFAPRASPGVWARLGPWLFLSIGPLTTSSLAGFPFPKPVGARLVLVALAAGWIAVALVTRTYRRTDAVGRRQIRWLAFGFHAGLAPAATVAVLVLVSGLVFGEWRTVYRFLGPSVSFAILIPISLVVATVRYNLFDVDRLLSASASYNLVLALLLGTGFVVVPRFGELTSGLLGLDPRVGQVALSLALAAVVVPAHQRLRPRIDRALFKERYALDLGIADLLRSLSECEDARALTQRAGQELARLLRPEACVVYARAGEAFAPVFVQGRGVPPVFAAPSPLVATLRQRRLPLALSGDGRRPDPADLGPFDRAALEALQAEVVVPIQSEERLVAFLCLGPKCSRDVYTSTDLAHLASVSDAVSSRVRVFGREAVIREERAMQESLRRYVPGVVAEELASGAVLQPEEREVTVLFVDLRGYSSFAEPRRPEEIFSTVNRYTETVSEVVRKHGGSVVEFNGDGMMAVFGAPRRLPDKERAAVETGREIVAAVGALPVEDSGGSAKLSVGVGIASGAAFVGSLRAADRLIWSAIGNTTNRAARLQALTRELDASIVIDAATWDELGARRHDFVRHGAMPIRGRRQVEDVFSLRLDLGLESAT
jgi:class 3 adenylate cyclase